MKSIKVNQYTTNGDYIKTWSSATEAEMYYCKSDRSHGKIGQVCKRNRRVAYGYVWRYASESITKEEIVLLFKEKEYTDEEIINLLTEKILNNITLPNEFWKNERYHKLKIGASLCNGNKSNFKKSFNQQYKFLSDSEKECINNLFFLNSVRKERKDKGISRPPLKQWISKEEIGLIVSQFDGINEFRYSSKENRRLYWYAFVKNDFGYDFKFKNHNLTIREENDKDYMILKQKQDLNEHFIEVCPNDAPFEINVHMLGKCYGFEVINKYKESVIDSFTELMNRNYISAISGPERRCEELKEKFEKMNETNEPITVTYEIKKNENSFVYNVYVDGFCYHRKMLFNSLNKRNKLFKYTKDGKKCFPSRYWTEDRIRKHASEKVWSNISEFVNKYHGAYKPLLQNPKLMEELFSYLILNDSLPGKTGKHLIYAYVVENDKTIYIGRTNNLRNRDRNHKYMMNLKKEGKKFYNYFKDKILPNPIILEDNIIGKRKSGEREDWWKQYYISLGWNILNTAKTGALSSSYGSLSSKDINEVKEHIIECDFSYTKLSKYYPNDVSWILKNKERFEKETNINIEELTKYDFNKIFAFTIDGMFVGEYPNFQNCAKELLGNKHLAQYIKRICEGGGDVNALTLKGYTFSYYRDGYIDPKEKKITKLGYRGRKVAKIKDDEIIEIRENAEAYRKDGFDPHTIRSVCRSVKHTHKGFVWRYLD